MNKVRLGIIGCGFFGGEFARIAKEMDGIELVAVYGGGGNTEKVLAQEIGCRRAESMEALVSNPVIDAVMVVSPSHLHHAGVLAAAKSGKHIFCEKPIALTYEDCKQMIEACERASVLFMAGHTMHFMPGIQEVKRLIEDGEIGDILVCHAERTGWEDRQVKVSWKKNNAYSGGHLFHHIHEIDLIQSLLGPAESICTAGGNLAHQGEGYGDEEDVLLLTMSFRNGAYATMQYGSGFRWGEHYLKINGTEGAILIDMKRSVVELKKNYKTTSYPVYGLSEHNEAKKKLYEDMDGGVIYGNPSSRPGAELSTLMSEELRCFRDAILHKRIDKQYRLLFDNTSAASSIRTAEAALKALKEKTWITIADD